jgi:hypothetical protein
MSNVMQFPGARPVPPKPAVDALLAELTAIEIEIARARLAQVRLETRQARVLWAWWCFKRMLFWGLALWLLSTLFAGAVEAGNFRNFYGPNGNFVGSSNTPGGGRFTNFYNRDGRLVATEVRVGGKRR